MTDPQVRWLTAEDLGVHVLAITWGDAEQLVFWWPSSVEQPITIVEVGPNE